MCTLIALHRCVRGAELVIAANRDEYLDRPAEGLALRVTAAGPVVAPLDRRAGGSWLGVNAAGLFAGVTNRPSRLADPSRRSRGLLVMDTLAAPSAAAAAEVLEQLPTRAYNPFNLLVADGRDAFAVVYEVGPRLIRLEPGAHVLVNADPDAREVPKLDRILMRARAAASEPADRALDALARICREHDGFGDPLGSPCVHAGAYGTRCSTLLRLGSDAPVLRHAEGPPCVTAYEDFTPLLDELGRAAGLAEGARAVRRAS